MYLGGRLTLGILWPLGTLRLSERGNFSFSIIRSKAQYRLSIHSSIYLSVYLPWLYADHKKRLAVSGWCVCNTQEDRPHVLVPESTNLARSSPSQDATIKAMWSLTQPISLKQDVISLSHTHTVGHSLQHLFYVFKIHFYNTVFQDIEDPNMLFTDIHETIYMTDGGVLSFSPLHISTTKKAHDFQGKLNSKRLKGKPASQKLQARWFITKEHLSSYFSTLTILV